MKREDLASPRYGGNKLRTLQHQLAAVEAHKDVSPGAVFSMIGSTGSNMVVATKVHGAATFGMAQEELQSLSFLPDKPDLDNTLNLLSTLSPGGSADFELRASAAVGAGVLSFHNALQRRLRQDVGITVLCHDGTTKIAACWPWNAIEGCHLAHDENGIGTTEAAMSITVRGLGVFTFEASQLFAFSTELGIRVAAFRRNRREARALAAAAGVDARRFAPTRDRPTSPQLQ